MVVKERAHLNLHFGGKMGKPLSSSDAAFSQAFAVSYDVTTRLVTYPARTAGPHDPNELTVTVKIKAYELGNANR